MPVLSQIYLSRNKNGHKLNNCIDTVIVLSHKVNVGAVARVIWFSKSVITCAEIGQLNIVLHS